MLRQTVFLVFYWILAAIALFSGPPPSDTFSENRGMLIGQRRMRHFKEGRLVQRQGSR